MLWQQMWYVTMLYVLDNKQQGSIKSTDSFSIIIDVVHSTRIELKLLYLKLN